MNLTSVIKYFLLSIILMMLTGALLHAQSPAAVVLDVRGKCRLIANGADKPVKNGMFVNSRDSLVIPPKGAVLLMDSLDRYITVITSSAYIMPAGESDKTGQFFREWLAARQWFEKTRKKGWDVLRSSSDQAVILNSPRNTRLFTLPLELTWTAKQSKRAFEISVRCYENDFSFKKSVRDNRFTLPDDIGLEQGLQYYWTVQPERSDISQSPTPVWFSVLSADQRKSFDEESNVLNLIMDKDTSSTSYRLLYANLLLKHQLYHDCRITLERVLSTEPQNPAALMFYARIMEQMDLPEQTKQYIELTDKYER